VGIAQEITRSSGFGFPWYGLLFWLASFAFDFLSYFNFSLPHCSSFVFLLVGPLSVKPRGFCIVVYILVKITPIYDKRL